MLNPEDAAREHIRALLAYEMDAVVDGYADDAVILSGGEPVVGIEAIGTMMRSLPREALPDDVTVDSLHSHGEFVFVTYHHEAMRGGDTFQVRDGKIVLQTVHMIQD